MVVLTGFEIYVSCGISIFWRAGIRRGGMILPPFVNSVSDAQLRSARTAAGTSIRMSLFFLGGKKSNRGLFKLARALADLENFRCLFSTHSTGPAARNPIKFVFLKIDQNFKSRDFFKSREPPALVLDPPRS